MKKMRTVRSCTLAIQPIISKHFIDFEVDENENENYESADNEESSSEREVNKKQQQKKYGNYSETSLDRIITKLMEKCKNHDVMIMITPSSRHKDQYKLHAIEKENGSHLGMVSVKQRELDKLKKSKIFQQFSIVIGTRYIDVKTVAVGGLTISNLLNTMKGSFCRLTDNDMVASFNSNNNLCKTRSPYTINLYNTDDGNSDNDNNDINCSGDDRNIQSIAILKTPENILHSENESCKDYNIIITEEELLTLMEHINILQRFKCGDIERFFTIAEHYKFHIKIRPELCRRNPSFLCDDTQNEHLCRFHLECFMPKSNTNADKNCRYLSSVLLNNELLQKQLAQHKQLSENIAIIEDVYDMLPFMPTLLKKLLYKLFAFCGLEILYDLIGEILYEFYRSFMYW